MLFITKVTITAPGCESYVKTLNEFTIDGDIINGNIKFAQWLKELPDSPNLSKCRIVLEFSTRLLHELVKHCVVEGISDSEGLISVNSINLSCGGTVDSDLPKEYKRYPLDIYEDMANSEYTINECRTSLHIATVFGKYPGGRYRTDGDMSAERLREEYLIPILEHQKSVHVDLDGTAGYGNSFLEEAFGGLIRCGYSKDRILSTLKFVETDFSRRYIEEIINFINVAETYTE